MSIKLAALAVAGVSLSMAGAPAEAHHSVQAVVDTTKVYEGQMVLTKVDWINPHSWFHFDFTKPDGTVVKDVLIEWLSVSGLKQAGYASPNVFTVGETYEVSYNPNRDGSVGGNLVSMVDDTTGQVFDRRGPGEPPPPPPPLPQLRPPPGGKTNVSY